MEKLGLLDVWIGCGIDDTAFVPICMTDASSFVAYGEDLKNLDAGDYCVGLVNSDGEYSYDERPPK